MTRSEYDSAFSAAVVRKSNAMTADDRPAVIAASAEILHLARGIVALKNAAGKSQKLTPEESSAVFWAAWHSAKFAPAANASRALISFADEVDRLAALGHSFAPKEQKIIDTIPFLGVDELFLRWKKRIEDGGYENRPEKNIKILFDWYRRHPDVEVPEALLDFLASHLTVDRQWFPFYYSELLTRLNRGAEMESPRARAVCDKPTDFRRWMALAECYATIPRRAVACMAKALRCTLLPVEDAPRVKTMLEARLRSALELDNRPIPNVFDDAFLAKASAPAERFILSSVPVVQGVCGNERRAKDGRRLIVFWYVNGMNERVCAVRPMTPELQLLRLGASVDLSIAKRGDVDEVLAVMPSRRPPWNGWSPFRAIVSRMDRVAETSTLVLDRHGNSVTLAWKKWRALVNLAAGRQVFVRGVTERAGGDMEIVSVSPARNEIKLPFARMFDGKMRRAPGAKYGFCGDVYVPGSLAAGFMDGNPVSGLAVASVNRTRNRLEWVAVRFDKGAFHG